MNQKVNVFSLQHRPHANLPHIVKWTVDGGHRSRAFRTKALADRYRSRLVGAHEQGEAFSPATGEPESWSAVPETFLTLAQRVVRSKWPTWSPMSRRAAVESIEAACIALVHPQAPPAPSYGPVKQNDLNPMRRWLWDCVLLPEKDARAPRSEEEAHAAWLTRWSLPIKAIDAKAIKAVRPALSVGVNGKPLGPDTLGKRRNNLSLVLTEAVTDGLLASNPVSVSRWTVAQDADEVDQRLLLSPQQCRDLIGVIGSVSWTSSRYTAYLHTLWLAGLRPSEATGLIYDLDDVQLPESGWGRLILRGGTVYTSRRWNDEDDNFADRGLKWRSRKSIREIPLPPELVEILRNHVKEHDVQVGDRLFTNSKGEPVDPGALGKLWRTGKKKADLTGAVAGVRIYDLRHSHATLALRAGVPVPEVARRLGHSPAVLLKHYAGVVKEDEETGNRLIERALGGE